MLCRSVAPYASHRPEPADPYVRTPGTSRPLTGAMSRDQSGAVPTRDGTSRSSRPSRVRAPTVKRELESGRRRPDTSDPTRCQVDGADHDVVEAVRAAPRTRRSRRSGRAAAASRRLLQHHVGEGPVRAAGPVSDHHPDAGGRADTGDLAAEPEVGRSRPVGVGALGTVGAARHHGRQRALRLDPVAVRHADDALAQPGTEVATDPVDVGAQLLTEPPAGRLVVQRLGPGLVRPVDAQSSRPAPPRSAGDRARCRAAGPRTRAADPP